MASTCTNKPISDHNYQVASARRGSKVVRRYSDFVWLLDCLQKRYPFRQLPLLPPKRVGGKFCCFPKVTTHPEDSPRFMQPVKNMWHCFLGRILGWFP